MRAPTLDSFSAFSATTDQPAAVSGNSILDTISGVVKGITPAASSAVSGAITGRASPSYVQGGSVASSGLSTGLIVGGGIAAVALVILLTKKRH